MNISVSNIKEFFSKRILLQFYFILFILLNVFDFLNFLSGDIDFFKKILSWILIGYVFYKASFSKIYVGVVNRGFDWLFMTGFIFIGVMKSVYHYVSISNLDDFFVFKFFLSLIPKESEVFLTYSSLLGIFIVILTSIYLLKKYKPTKNSLIGSFELSEYMKFIGTEYFILSGAALFFGLVVFNYIMEWFALAVDSIILVIGLIFYLFMFLHRHTKVKTDKILSLISNTGSNFYQNMINQFSNRKTFMIGVSFILLLHLLVDIGVYLIPFLTGLQNTLYGSIVDDSIPIFNLIDFKNSQFFIDLLFVNFEPVSIVSLFLIHLSSIVLFGLLMFLPFYYFYKNISFKNIKLSSFVEVLFLVCLSVQLLVLVIPNLNNPITMDWSLDSQVIGVDLNTSSVLGLGGDFSIELIIILILSLVLIVESKYLIKSSINDFISKKIISGVVLLFFFVYILIFGITTVSHEFESTLLKDRIVSDQAEFDVIMDLYNESLRDLYNYQIFAKTFSVDKGAFKMDYNLFSTYNYSNPNSSHTDFIIYNISNVNNQYVYNIKNHKTNAVFDGNHKKISDYFNSDSFVYIYKLGENRFDIYQKERKGFGITYEAFENLEFIELAAKSKMTNTVDFVRLVILFVFYFIGLLIFTRHFFRTNIRNS
jgi:hypothetical protein